VLVRLDLVHARTALIRRLLNAGLRRDGSLRTRHCRCTADDARTRTGNVALAMLDVWSVPVAPILFVLFAVSA
jgi:hypothetical protein